MVRFNDKRFLDGAVQLRWVQEGPEQAPKVATAFVFHGPHYNGAGEARQEGVDASYRLNDTASLVVELVDSFQAGLRGEDRNPFCARRDIAPAGITASSWISRGRWLSI